MKVRITKAAVVGGKVVAPGTVVEVSSDVGEKLLERGCGTDASDGDGGEDLSELTNPELIDLAEQRGVDLTGASKKSEYIERLTNEG
jgi:hypothetical protein